MAAVSFSGIASGIDTDSLIKATLDAARATKVTPNETKKTDLSDQNDALTTLKTKLSALQDAVQPFRTVSGGAVARSASSSDDSVATATANAGVTKGSYSVTVSQLAEPGRVVFPSLTASFPATTTTLGDATAGLTNLTVDGNFDFTFNPPLATTQTTKSFAVTTTTTLSQLTDALNSDSTFSTYADAALVNVGTSTTPAYRLVITAKNTGETVGADNAIDFSLSGGAVVTVAPDEADGQNAEFTIGGIGTTTISRSTNDITDVITGLTLNLRDTGTTKITIGVDVTATTTRVKDFIAAYNDVVSFLHANNTVERQESGKDVTNTFGPLAKSSLDENLMTLIRTDLSSSTSTSGASIRIFADIGITTDSGTYNSDTKTGGGTLKLDSDTVSSSLQRTLANALSLEPDAVEELLEDFGEAVGNLTSGTIAQFINFNRLLDTAINSNKTQISDLDSRIAEAEKSLTRQEELLKTRYARLESLMGSLQSKQASLTSALAGLG